MIREKVILVDKKQTHKDGSLKQWTTLWKFQRKELATLAVPYLLHDQQRMNNSKGLK